MNTDSLMPLDGDRITSQDVQIDATQPLVLSVTNSSGDISITAADRDGVRVVAERTDDGKRDEEARIDIDVQGNKISVHPNWQIGSTIGEIARKVKHQLKEGFNSDEWDLKNMKFGMNAKFDIRIELPRQLAEGSSVSIKTASGDVSVADVAARVSAATANGDVDLARITGKASAHSASGDIAFTNVDGSIEANTANGDIQVNGGEAWTALRAVNGDVSINGLTMKNARITTVSGDILAKATLDNTAPYTFDTVSGDINLVTTVPASGARLNYKAVSGDVKVSGDWTQAHGKRTWQLAAGGDGPDIRVKAVSGDLDATATGDPNLTLRHETAAPAQEEAETEPASDSGNIAPDFDWDKARGWVSQVTQKITQAIGDMDEAGPKKTPPTPPTPPVAELPVPPVPPTPPHGAETPADAANTEPVPTPSSAEETAPVPPSPAWANTSPMSPPPAPEPTTETNPQRRLRLLEAVQRGEMTVDEALAQLDGDGGGSASE